MKGKIFLSALSIALAMGLAGMSFADDATDTAAPMSQDQSAQPGTDTWITTKVKTELMATKGIPSTEISVTTTNGIVTLSGVLENKAQVQKSVAIAKAVKGVNKVDSSALSTRN